MLRTPFWSNDGAALGPGGAGQHVSMRTHWPGEGPLSSRDSRGGCAQEGCRAGGPGSSGSQWEKRQVQPKTRGKSDSNKDAPGV